MTTVEQWFGAHFADLHPLIRDLHRNGGTLRGRITVDFDNGLAGWVGRRLARRLGIAIDCAEQLLNVRIHDAADGLHWDRQFNGTREFRSLFVPVGSYPHGHWIENSGALKLRLHVRIVAGGWHWMPAGAQLGPIALPPWMLGSTVAYKEIIEGCYNFQVKIRLPLLGTILRYGGLLALEANDTDDVNARSHS